jgi:hypothetical protein
MALVSTHPTHVVEFLPYYLQLPQNVQLSCAECNARDNFVSIWDTHQIILDHPWAIRALRGYATLVFIQRKLKLWLYEKRLLSLRPFLPFGSFVLLSIQEFLSPPAANFHPTLLVVQKQGLLQVLWRIEALPYDPPSLTPIRLRYRRLHTYIIHSSFTRRYNEVISTFAVPRPSPDFRISQGFAR